MRLHCWLIFGGEHVRKGSLIRALTGMGRDNDFDLSLVSGQCIQLWTKIKSINEDVPPQDPDEWVDSFYEDTGRSRSNFLVAFRLDRGDGYNAKDYVDALVRRDVIIESVVTLRQNSPDWLREYGIPHFNILESLPTNELAHIVRTAWGWM